MQQLASCASEDPRDGLPSPTSVGSDREVLPEGWKLDTANLEENWGGKL